MKILWALAFVACAVVLGVAQTVTGPYGVVTVTLPAGKTAAGRQAFEDLRCYVCHQKAGETRFSAPVSASRGPDLDETLQRQSASEVAAATRTLRTIGGTPELAVGASFQKSFINERLKDGFGEVLLDAP